jgi:hypothetical protein
MLKVGFYPFRGPDASSTPRAILSLLLRHPPSLLERKGRNDSAESHGSDTVINDEHCGSQLLASFMCLRPGGKSDARMWGDPPKYRAHPARQCVPDTNPIE